MHWHVLGGIVTDCSIMNVEYWLVSQFNCAAPQPLVMSLNSALRRDLKASRTLNNTAKQQKNELTSLRSVHTTEGES